MKVAICFLATLACAFSFPSEEIDFARIQPRHLYVDIPKKDVNTPSLRIINGKDAEPGTHRYQAGLVINQEGFCGGSLIRKDFILTAAHCIDTAQQAQVVLGFHEIYDGLRSQYVIYSTTFHVHPSWSPNTLRGDVGLIKIEPVDSSRHLAIIPLAPANAPSFAGSQATLSGWGKTSDASTSIASHLQVIQLEIITNLRCRLNFLGQIIDNEHLCTLGSHGGACNGDSGGPLVVNGVQVGIVSFGFFRCEAGWPSVFARVSEFRNYIDSVLKNNN